MKTKRTPTKIDKARIIIQAKNAWLYAPDANEPAVVKLSQAPLNELNELYEWAVGAMSAMRWNTATLGG